MADSAAFAELVHRVNNLLGAITIQVEVARSDGSLAAHAEALRLIAQAAERTADDVQRLVRGARTGGDDGRS